jgi:hypothetical protein
MKMMEPLLKKEIVGHRPWTLSDSVEDDLGLETLFGGLDQVSTYLGERLVLLETHR